MPVIVRAALLSLALVACGKSEPAPAPAPRPEFGHFRWSSFPVSLRVQDQLMAAPSRKHDLRVALTFWERHAGKRLFDVAAPWPGTGMPFSGPADAPTEITANAMVFSNGGSLEPGVAGLTSLRVDSGTIEGAVILVDPSENFCSGLCESEDSATSLRRLLAHELGHFLGMAHSPDPENIMYPMIRPGGSLRDRTVDDATLHRLTL